MILRLMRWKWLVLYWFNDLQLLFLIWFWFFRFDTSICNWGLVSTMNIFWSLSRNCWFNIFFRWIEILERFLSFLDQDLKCIISKLMSICEFRLWLSSLYTLTFRVHHECSSSNATSWTDISISTFLIYNTWLINLSCILFFKLII